MRKISCLILDDVELEATMLADLVADFNDFDLVGTYTNVSDAIQYIHKNPIDLLLLDVNMPLLDGFAVYRSLPNAPEVIFTTAHAQHAAEAFDIDALDYLIKPVTRERFSKAMLRASSYFELKWNTAPTDETADHIFLRVEGNYHKFYFTDILYIEAMSNFVKIFTKEKSYVSYGLIRFFEEHLSSKYFKRVHKSYIVNFSKVDQFNSDEIKIDGKTIPLGTAYKESFQKLLLEGKFLKTRE
jgi:DNA-binding LytR/AlgR family response regulator